MSFTTTPAMPSEWLVWLLTAMMDAVARPGRSPAFDAWRMPVHRRINRVRILVAALLGRIAEGTLRPFRSRRAPAGRKPIDEARRQRFADMARDLCGMPRRPGWLLGLGHLDVAGRASQLLHLLQHDPEIRRLLEQHPQLGRALRPLCRMLGIDPAVLGAGAPPPRTPRRRAVRPVSQGAAGGAAFATGDAPGKTPRRRRGVRPGEPSAAEITREINRRRWPSIEQQAAPERYPWTPIEAPQATAGETSG